MTAVKTWLRAYVCVCVCVCVCVGGGLYLATMSLEKPLITDCFVFFFNSKK